MNDDAALPQVVPEDVVAPAQFIKARALAARHWPGPLTLVLPLRPDHGITTIVTAGLATIALRMPAHAAMQDVIRAVGRPLAAPSANASGTISPTRAAHVARTLNGRIPLILDGGPTDMGLESTIVAVEGDKMRLLRPGPIDLSLQLDRSGRIEAPGQLDSHYAPAKPLRLNATSAHADEWLIGFGPMLCDANLSESGNLVEAAARLFDCLHEADRAGKPRIAMAPLPLGGLGDAIQDRLARAAACFSCAFAALRLEAAAAQQGWSLQILMASVIVRSRNTAKQAGILSPFRGFPCHAGCQFDPARARHFGVHALIVLKV